jgi:threonine dehydrogenase-like Zn-dependent dehydrogenase
VRANRPGVQAFRYGTTPISEKPGLWGGFSQLHYWHPDSVFHRVPDDTPAELAAPCLPTGNGFQWTYLDGRAGPGKTVLIKDPDNRA